MSESQSQDKTSLRGAVLAITQALSKKYPKSDKITVKDANQYHKYQVIIQHDKEHSETYYVH